MFILCVVYAGMLDIADEDVSFSDLEDDENKAEHAKVFHLNKNLSLPPFSIFTRCSSVS